MSLPQTMKAVQVNEQSKNEPTSLHWADVALPQLNTDEVLVKIKAFGLNRMDLMQRRGMYPVPPGASPILGVEFSGTIATSNGHDDAWKEGDEVFGLALGGAYAEYIACVPRLLVKKPKELSWAQAAAIPEQWLTAFQTAIDIGGLSKGKSILVHAGASGVGTSAIQLARLFGASKIFATAGSDEKVAFLEKQLKATKAFNYKTQDWAQGVAEASNGQEVDIVLDFVGPSYWDGNIKVLGRDGRMVLIGLLSGLKTAGPIDMGQILFKRLRIEGTTLRSRTVEYQADLMQRFAKEAFPKMLSQDHDKLDLVIHKVFDAKDIVDATKCMESAQNIGKLICEFQS